MQKVHHGIEGCLGPCNGGIDAFVGQQNGANDFLFVGKVKNGLLPFFVVRKVEKFIKGDDNKVLHLVGALKQQTLF